MHKTIQKIFCTILFLSLGLLYVPQVFAVIGDVQLDVSTGGQIIGSALITNKFTDTANADYYLDPAASTTSLTVAGNVGIGTTSPNGKLAIAAGTTGSGYGFYMDSLTRTNTETVFYMTGAAAGNEVVIDGRGYVGIGSVTPTHKLQTTIINDTAGVYYPLNVQLQRTNTSSSERGAGISFQERTSGSVQTALASIVGIRNNSNSDWYGNLAFYTHPTNSSEGDSGLVEKMRIRYDGNVTGTYGNYHVASDVRRKKDIVTIPSALDKVLALRGVNFRWKDDSDNGSLQLGMIAQEAELVVPEVVHTSDDEMQTKAIEYPFLAGLFVEAIKEQQSQIVSLQSITTDFISKFKEGLIETKKLIVDGVDIAKKLSELSDKSDKQQQQIDELRALINTK